MFGEVTPPAAKQFHATRKDSNALNQEQMLDIVNQGKIQIIDARAEPRFLPKRQNHVRVYVWGIFLGAKRPMGSSR